MICAMSPAPLVSIVVPVHNDEGTIEAALASCLAQTLREIEVVCVDDASDDGTVAAIERMQRTDSRIRLVRHEENRSALQARRSGVMDARGDAILFLDGDDELESRAAEVTLAAMQGSGADLVQFDVTVVDRHGNSGGAFERRLAPQHDSLRGSAVVTGLFPADAPARGQLWRFLFRTTLLRAAHAHLREDVSLVRVNDLPLMFLAAALAQHLVSVPEKLYRYHLGRGGSGHQVDTIERARFYAAAIDSVDIIRDAVASVAAASGDATAVHEAYAAARLWTVGYVCRQLVERADPSIVDSAVEHLRTKTTDDELLAAAGAHSPGSLAVLARHVDHQPITNREVRSILLVTSTLRTGGVTAVLATQARVLAEAGFRVTVVARNSNSDPSFLPSGVELVELAGGGIEARLEAWRAICLTRSVDVVIDHQMLYSSYWPEFAAMTRACGGATVGWLHNFVARPLLDGDDRLGNIEKFARVLAHVVALSPLDVSYLKLRGITHSSYIPNPPSAMLDGERRAPRERPTGLHPINLVWWGRLEERTKRVSELLEVAVLLQRRHTAFSLTVIGPDWGGWTAAKFNALARRRGVAEVVRAVGPKRGRELEAAIDTADAFLSTSLIEGYQLTIAEAQSRGLPVFMYELPWLTLVQENAGITSVRQGDAAGLADAITAVAANPVLFARLSRGSLDAAERAGSYDFSDLYRRVVTGAPTGAFSPEPTLEDARLLLGLVRFYSEANRSQTKTVTPRRELAARMWRRVAPLGRVGLQRLPGLRPLVARLKRRMGIAD